MQNGSMHHELLLALSGYPGNVFRVSKESDVMEVDSSLPFIHPSEVSLLNKICQLGTHYIRIKKFISSQDAAAFSLPPVLPPPASAATCSGIYMKALSCGMDKVLNNYRQALVALEKKCMCEPHLTLSTFLSQLEEYHLLLPALEACVEQVLTRKSWGCQVLGYIYDQCSSGIPIVQQSFERILGICHGVLYKQLSAWMLHGLLVDKQGEFFIEVRKKDEKGMNGEGPVAMAMDKAEAKEFVINHSLAPSYFPARVLEKILFVGEAVTIFQSRKTGKEGVQPSGSKFRSGQFRFSGMLLELQQQPKFQLHKFEKVIDCIRDCVAEMLWNLLVEESDLAGHLKLMKDFFLLGRGELFLAFIDLAHGFMSLPPSATTQHDVNVAFQQAMVMVGMDSESMTKEFQLTVPFTKLRGIPKTTPTSQGEPLAGNAWSQLTFTHSMEWPLPIIFTPSILTRYNTLFQVLLGLRRTQVSLHHTWALLMQHRLKLGELRHIWQLRTHMGFLVDNLQYYVQVDVLETQFSQLLEKVRTTHDYETIKHAHEKYLTTLQSQLFLTYPAISHCLQEILSLCNSFSSLLQASKELCLSSQEQAQVSRISQDFAKQSSLFFDIISGVSSAPHLAQLLLRVDYNKYFSTKLKT